VKNNAVGREPFRRLSQNAADSDKYFVDLLEESELESGTCSILASRGNIAFEVEDSPQYMVMSMVVFGTPNITTRR